MAKAKTMKKAARKAKKAHSPVKKAKIIAKKHKPAIKKAPKKIARKTAKPAKIQKSLIKKTLPRGLKKLKQVPMAKPIPTHILLQKIPSFKGPKKKFYEMLLEARRQFEQQVNFHTTEALSAPGTAGELSNSMSNHMADFGSDNFLHDMELEMMSGEAEVLEMIDEAIERLIAGEYGKCLDCGFQITMQRLEAKPYARFCIKCKTAREENNGLRPEFNR